jgi:hypothetical protein
MPDDRKSKLTEDQLKMTDTLYNVLTEKDRKTLFSIEVFIEDGDMQCLMSPAHKLIAREAIQGYLILVKAVGGLADQLGDSIGEAMKRGDL